MRKSRLDRELTVNVVHPLTSLIRRKDNLGIPILMYHGIRGGALSKSEYHETHTTPDAFASHMHWLRDRGYRALDLNEVAQELDSGRALANTVAITFDDGYLDFYTTALPVMEECGFKATVFVVSEFACNSRNTADDSAYMSWKQIRECQSRGVLIGSHTATHPELLQLSPAQVDRELEISRKAIEDELGTTVRSFSFPYAFPEHQREFARRVRSQLQAHGYETAVTTIIGTAKTSADRLLLPRLPINSYDDVSLFRAKLEGAYNWLHIAQFTRKLLRGNRINQQTLVIASR